MRLTTAGLVQVRLMDVSRAPTTGAQVAATWDGLEELRDLEFEELAFDRLLDERGRWIKDISHADCRYLTPEEILRVLRTDLEEAPYRVDPYGFAVDGIRQGRSQPADANDTGERRR